MSNYDIIKVLAHDCRIGATEAIYNRLLAWRSFDKAADYSNWIGDTQAMVRCIRAINRQFSIRFMKENRINGWACGLCQMLDSNNQNVCELLPLLLTAYIYNFPQNQFVSCFLKKDFAMGLSESVLFGSKIHETIENESNNDVPDASVVGIGRLLMGQMPKDRQQELKHLADRFSFPPIQPIRLKDDFVRQEDDYFVPPTSHGASIMKGIKQINLGPMNKDVFKDYVTEDDSSGDAKENTDYVGLLEIPPSDHVIYEKQFVLFLFATIYSIVKKQHEIHKKDFVCSPDLLKSWILLSEAIQDNNELTTLENDLAEGTSQNAIARIERRLAVIEKQNAPRYGKRVIRADGQI